MKNIAAVLVLCLFACLAFGQDAPPNISKYIWVETDRLNPAMGQTYEKVAKTFRQAMESNKSSMYWIAMAPITGPMNTVTYVAFSGTYAGIESMMKDMDDAGAQIAKKDANFIREAMESAPETRSNLAMFRPDLSMRPEMVSVAEATRYRVTDYHVKPGMNTTFVDLVKEVQSLDKEVPTAHWMTYQSLSGEDGTVFTVVTPLKSLADLDQDNSMSTKIFTPAIMRDLDRRVAECVKSSSTTFFSVRPALSRVLPETAAANPSFWTVKEEPIVAAAPKAKRGKKTTEVGQ